jgi:hypothetical protein
MMTRMYGLYPVKLNWIAEDAFGEAGEDEEEEVMLLHCCYTAVTLLLHCCYTIVTLLLHCRYTFVTLLSHCCYAVGSPKTHLRKLARTRRRSYESVTTVYQECNKSVTNV